MNTFLIFVSFLSLLGIGQLFNFLFFKKSRESLPFTSSFGTGAFIIVLFTYLFILFPTTGLRLPYLVLNVVGISSFLSLNFIFLKTRKFNTKAIITLLLFLVQIGFLSFVAFHNQSISCQDDELFYLRHINMILNEGSLIDPFSLRRMASYSGHQILQAFLMAGADNLENINLLEKAFFPVFFSLSVYFIVFKEVKSQLTAFFITLSSSYLYPPAINTTSTFSASIIVIHILYAFIKYPNHKLRDNTFYLYTYILAGVVLTFRANYLAFFGIYWLFDVYQNFKHENYFASQKIGGAVFILILLLGSTHLFASSNTFFFPLMKGNYSTAMKTFEGFKFKPNYFHYMKYMYEKSRTFEFCSIIIILTYFLRHRLTILGAGLAHFISFGILNYLIYSTNSPTQPFRYQYPFFLALAYLLIIFYAKEFHTGNVSPKVRLILFFSTSVLFYDSYRHFILTFENNVSITSMRSDRKNIIEIKNKYKQALDAAIAVIPEHSNVLSAIDRPYLYNVKVNPLTFHVLDIPSNASPKRGLNLYQPTEKILKYLVQQRYDYYIFEDQKHSTCFYSTYANERHLAKDQIYYTDPNGQWKIRPNAPHEDLNVYTAWAPILFRLHLHQNYFMNHPKTIKIRKFYIVPLQEVLNEPMSSMP